MADYTHTKDFPDSFYRATVKGLIVVDGKIMLLKESPQRSGRWELPGGGLDFGEDIHQGLRREIEEETGLQVKSISNQPIYVWTWYFEKAYLMKFILYLFLLNLILKIKR